MGKILRPEVQADMKSSGGLMELADNHMIGLLNVTLSELDFISDNMTQEELDDLVTEKLWVTFSHKKKVLMMRDKYLKIYNHIKNGEGKS